MSLALGLQIYDAVITNFERYFPMAVAFLALLLFFVYGVTVLAKDLKKHVVELETFNNSFGENLKLFLVPVAISDALAFGALILSTYFSLFPEQVSGSLRLEILKTVTQANGFLIGFTGIVFAQMLWAINNQQCSIQTEMIRNEGEQSHVGYTNISPSEAPADFRQRYVNVLEKKRRTMIYSMFLVIGLFVFSIAMSLSEMARTGAYGTDLSILTPTKPDLVRPVLSMILGILLFVFSIATSKLSLTEEEKQKPK